MIPLLIILACLLIQQGYEWISPVPCSSFLPGCGNLPHRIFQETCADWMDISGQGIGITLIACFRFSFSIFCQLSPYTAVIAAFLRHR